MLAPLLSARAAVIAAAAVLVAGLVTAWFLRDSGRASPDTPRLAVATLNLFEVFKRIAQQRGEGAALKAVAHMQQARVLDLDSTLALAAAQLSLQLKLPPADSVILASARACHATLWTQDEHFARVPGVKYVMRKP